MSMANPATLLHKALGLSESQSAFPWQTRLLSEFLAGETHRALDIPTGLGKTSVMAIWLVARYFEAPLPRRLVYVVDRRAVVDQASEEAVRLQAFVEASPAIQEKLGSLPVSTLRGKHIDNREWLTDPGANAIVVATVDMAGSRLLFSGYGVSRKMRPYQAGFIGADTLFVLDEAHLVPPFEKLLESVAATSWTDDDESRALVPKLHLLSLSATGRSDQPAFEIDAEDLKPDTVTHTRLTAAKSLSFDPLSEGEELSAALARNAWTLSNQGTSPVKVIVFVNSRKEALKTKTALDNLAKLDKKEGKPAVEICSQLLVGGRRVREREQTFQWLKEHGFVAGSKSQNALSQFVIATSAGEVGVDLDADHMVGDLVEWERMIQRFGRVNRRGEGAAKIVIMREPPPKPTKAEDNAFKKPVSERSDKDLKTIAGYEKRVAHASAKAKPFALLSEVNGQIDVSPAALREMKRNTVPLADDSEETQLRKSSERAILSAATTPTPLRPALTRPLVDAWAMTSLHEHTGRPKIQPWLRGWIEEDPQTTVVWRRHLPIDQNRGPATSPQMIADFFDAAPIHVSEELELPTREDILPWLKKRAEALINRKVGPDSEGDLSGDRPLRADDPFAIILDKNGDVGNDSVLSLSRFINSLEDNRNKATLEASLCDATLVLDRRFGGLTADGMLNPDASSQELPLTIDQDDSSETWIDTSEGVPVIPFKVKVQDVDQPRPQLRKGWTLSHRVEILRSPEDEPRRWLLVLQWRSQDTTADSSALAASEQALADHQAEAVRRIESIARKLALPEPYRRMLSVAARLHDEGKQAPNWQDAFNAPLTGRPYAKTRGPINQQLLDGYRHELGSLPALERDAEFKQLPADLQDLALHIVAAHHGFARPLISVSGSIEPPSLLDQRARDVALRFIRLQRRWGPWGLAWWESLLRAADQQASKNIGTEPEPTSPSHG